MRLIKFRITDYKSIKDTGYCWLASDLTTLAGKNESGKSAILESLRDFDTDIEKMPDEALPLDESGTPIIEMCFEVNKATFDEIAKEVGMAIDKNTREHISKNGLTIIKYHDGNYGLEDEIDEALNKQRGEANQQHIKKIKGTIEKLSKLEQLAGLAKPDLDGDIESTQQAVSQYIEQAKAQVPSIPDEEKKQNVNRKQFFRKRKVIRQILR